MGIGSGGFRSNTQLSGGLLFPFYNRDDALDTPSAAIHWTGTYMGPTADTGVNVKMFGAKGDGETDDTEAVRRTKAYTKALNFVIATSNTNPNSARAAAVYFPDGQFVVTDTVFFGIDEAAGENYADAVANVRGSPGAIIIGRTNGKPVFEFTGCYNVRMDGITIFGDSDDTPNIGILLAQSAGDASPLSAGAGSFVNVKLFGTYTLACVYNYTSEINKWVNCEFRNKAGRAAYIFSATNANLAVTSANTTLGTDYHSAYGDRFTNCDFRNTGDGSDDECVVLIESSSFGPKFVSCYFNPTSEEKPIFRLVAAGGAGVTAARTKGVSCWGCVFESGYDSVFWIDHTVSALYMRACSLSETAPGTADIVVTANGILRHPDIQPYRGNANIEKVTVSNSGTIGWTKNKGTATVVSGDTFVAVTHGLESTPDATHLNVTATNNLGTATHFWVSDIGASTFRINVDQDPGATTATFAWQGDMDFV